MTREGGGFQAGCRANSMQKLLFCPCHPGACPSLQPSTLPHLQDVLRRVNESPEAKSGAVPAGGRTGRDDAHPEVGRLNAFIKWGRVGPETGSIEEAGGGKKGSIPLGRNPTQCLCLYGPILSHGRSSEPGRRYQGLQGFMLEGVPYIAFGSLTYRPGKAVFGTWGLENHRGSGATAPKVGNSPSQ